MPNFYFHVVDGDERLEDSEGICLDSLEAARETAIEMARELMAESHLMGEPVDGPEFQIVDEEGALLLRLPFRSAIPN